MTNYKTINNHIYDNVIYHFSDSWRSEDFEKVLINELPTYKKYKRDEIALTGKIPVVDQGAELIAGYINDDKGKYSGALPLIIFGDHTRNVKYVDFDFAVGADGTKLLKPKEQLLEKFFYYFLKSIFIPPSGYSRHYKYLKEIKVPVPDKAIQQKIIYSLDSLVPKVQAQTNRLIKAKKLVYQFRQSILFAAITGKLTEDWREKNNVGEWEKKTLAEVCITITDGDHQPPPKASTGVPFIVISDINNGKINLKTRRFVPRDYYENLPVIKKAIKGDILYTVVGSYGIPVLVENNCEFVFQRHIALLRPGKEIKSQYLYYVMKSDLVFKQATEAATGTAQMTVPLSGLRQIVISLPTLEEQEEIMNKVSKYLDYANTVETQIENAEERVSKLTQAILAKTFNNEYEQ